MMLELNDVLAIISQNNIAMMIAIDQWSAKNPRKAGTLNELRNLFNTYTGNIARSIVKAEEERVDGHLEGMEKYEFKTDEEPANPCLDCKHWDIPKRECGAWDQRGSSGLCDLFKPREGSE